MERQMRDRVEQFEVYLKAIKLFDDFIEDSEWLLKDIRGREIAKQMTRSVGSISANIEEGYGRGFGKELAYFLRIARGSARESRGWYLRSKWIMPKEIIPERIKQLDIIICMLVSAINKLSQK